MALRVKVGVVLECKRLVPDCAGVRGFHFARGCRRVSFAFVLIFGFSMFQFMLALKASGLQLEGDKTLP